MFFGSFAWSFVYISLPFHIQAISTWDASATLRWTGWILGITPLVTVVTAPLWGRLGRSGDPKTLYAGVQAVQGIGFFGMAIARTPPELFLARLVLGVMGAASTFAFMSAGRSTDIREVRRQVAAVQSAMTVGQVIGPLAGAIAAARLGFQESFVLGGLVLVACGALVHWGVPRSGVPQAPRAVGARTRWREVIAVAFMLLGGSTQIFFLTSILPQVLPPLGVEPSRTLEVGGFIIFASGAAAALGSVLAPRLSDVWPEHRLVAALLVASSLSVALLALVNSVWLYGILRFLQVLFIAPIFPIVVSRITQSAGGEAIGVINSARIGAAFIGPVIATTMLAWTSPALLYIVLGAIGVSCLPLVSVRGRGAKRRAG